jgi:hypothetical protein
MGKKITGPTTATGATPWIFTDHGRTYVGVDYTHGTSQWEVRVDQDGVTLAHPGDMEGQIWFPKTVLPMLIKALQRAQK